MKPEQLKAREYFNQKGTLLPARHPRAGAGGLRGD